MHSVLQLLKERHILGNKGPLIRSVNSLNLKDFVDITQEIEIRIRSNHRPVKNHIFSHSASLNLGGSSIECSYIDCRIQRIDNLARFALMYSDKVFISSFFSGYVDLDSNVDLNLAKKNFYDDLLVIQKIRPLVEKGIIEFFAPEVNVCFSCQARSFLGDSAGKKLDSSYKKLQLDYLLNMSVKAERTPDGYDFNCKGPAPYFDHEMVRRAFHVPDSLIKRPSILKKLKKGDIVPISKTMIKDLGLHIERAHLIVTNAIFGLATSNCLNTTFLTENDLHIQFLNSLHSSVEVSRRNLIAQKYLTSIVPFVEDVELKNLIKLRHREEEAFILYRQALNNAIDNLISNSGSFSEKDAQSLYADVIAPSLAHLDIKIKRAKKDLVSKPLRSLTGIVGIISFGLLTGLVPSDISEIVKTLGLIKFGSDFIKDVMALGDNDKSIKSDHFYFLWKVKKAARTANIGIGWGRKGVGLKTEK